jgi:membrane-associated HD superfamily phosphohydrolase
MESHLEVDQKDNLVRVQAPKPKYAGAIRIAARVISYIFHPLFIPVYLGWLVLKTDSYLFGSFNDRQKLMLLASFGVMYIMFPLVSVLLMKALGFISSIHLRTQKDRIIPYVVCMIWYWWMWYVMSNRPDNVPKDAVVLSLAIFLACIGGLMANIRMKVSMHAIAAGVMAAFVMLLGLSQDVNFGIYITLSILLTGVTCTARLIDGNHTTKEIYWGLFIGIFSVVMASKFA